jgi:hypothetical protein
MLAPFPFTNFVEKVSRSDKHAESYAPDVQRNVHKFSYRLSVVVERYGLIEHNIMTKYGGWKFEFAYP